MPTKFEPAGDGLIHNPNLEIMAAHGCNLTCRSCTHASPVLRPKDIAEPDVTRRDLTRLARWYRAQRVKLLGGEPLLHPDLVALAEAVRASGITDTVTVVTNGVLLPRQGPEFWAAVDEVWVSVYPGYEPGEGEVDRWRELGTRYGTELTISRYDQFRESHSEYGTHDRHLVRRIYNTCEIVNLWRCHTVINGVFYKCPEGYFLPVLRGEEPRDGLVLTDDAGTGANLLTYLNSEEPLYACRFCLGTVGLAFPHQQVRRREWRTPQQKPTEDLVDYAYLAEREEKLPHSYTWRTQTKVL
ncbi:MAG TPA: radical SAM protein [Actinophytocola sp.]|uniref:radical SAM protein n=1 Tax=Actinophytocola sp. TaxID=1872138 RepID=UPI002E0B90E2|nr:radical SAM protein [Actinophytocola sp.]